MFLCSSASKSPDSSEDHSIDILSSAVPANLSPEPATGWERNPLKEFGKLPLDLVSSRSLASEPVTVHSTRTNSSDGRLFIFSSTGCLWHRLGPLPLRAAPLLLRGSRTPSHEDHRRRHDRFLLQCAPRLGVFTPQAISILYLTATSNITDPQPFDPYPLPAPLPACRVRVLLASRQHSPAPSL